MSVELTINSLYQTPGASTWKCSYTITWDSSVTWSTIVVKGFGAQGYFSESLSVSSLVSYSSDNVASITKTSTLDTNNTFAPIIQDPSFNVATNSPWTLSNSTIGIGVANLTATNSYISQGLTLEAGNYTLQGSLTGSVNIYLDDFLLGTALPVTFSCGNGKHLLSFKSSFGAATVDNLSIVVNNMTYDSPLILAALDSNNVVKEAVEVTSSNLLLPASDFISGSTQAYALQVTNYSM